MFHVTSNEVTWNWVMTEPNGSRIMTAARSNANAEAGERSDG